MPPKALLPMILAMTVCASCNDESSPNDVNCNEIPCPNGESCIDNICIPTDKDNCNESTKKDDSCECQNGEWQCKNTNECPAECPDDCTDGICNPQQTCPAECPDDCTDGICNTQQTCPETCTNGCDDDGNCQCPETCSTTCDANGLCQCPETCSTTCDTNGLCQCPETCSTTCDTNGLCQCPETCSTTCDANGVCQCPETCSTTCDANGVCPVMCGGEKVISMYFGSKEQDIIAPAAISGISIRNASTSTVNIKTEKKTYTLEDAPCPIALTSTDAKVISVKANKKSCEFTAIGPGTAQCVASIKDENGKDLISTSLKVHVLNPKRLEEKTANKNIYHNSSLLVSGASQGFDFYNDDYLFFTWPRYLNPDNTDYNENYNLLHCGIYKLTPPNKRSKHTFLFGSGHCQNLSIEHTESKDYAWISDYGTLNTDKYATYNKFMHSQTIARIPLNADLKSDKFYEKDSNYQNESEIEQYYYSDKTGESYYYNFEPIMDFKNGWLGFRAYHKKEGKNYLKFFNLNTAKKLPLKTITLPQAINTVVNKQIVTKKENSISLKVRDLADYEGNVLGFSTKDLKSQGVEFENYILYEVHEVPEAIENSKYGYKSKIYIRMRTQTGQDIGEFYLKSASSKDDYLAPEDFDSLVDEINEKKPEDSRYNVGFYEPEGIRVSDGKVYVSVFTRIGPKRDSHDNLKSREIVLVYDLTK